MRRCYGFVLLFTISACADSRSPTDATPRLSPGSTIDVKPLPKSEHSVDSLPIMARLDAAVGRALQPLMIPADDFSKSAEGVHPDVACTTKAWNGAACWLMYTPYQGSDASWENPAILRGQSDTSWVTPDGVHNPIVPFPGLGQYNSDPDHAFDPGTGRLIEIHRVVNSAVNRIMIMSTGDTHEWTVPVLAFKESNHDAVSPALIIDADRTARVWYVQAGPEGCSARATSIVMRTAEPAPGQRFEDATWSPASPVKLAIPGNVIWHLDVIALPPGRGYLALVVAYPKGWTCANDDLWLAWSPDGDSWTSASVPLLWTGMKSAKAQSIHTWYRGTMRYDARVDSLHVWPSGMSESHVWSLYHTVVKLATIQSWLVAASPGDYSPTQVLAAPPLRLDRAAMP
jgi:hypothetical protein